MNHSFFFKFISLHLIFLFSYSSSLYAQDRPNVVIIYADDMGYSDVGAYGALDGITSPASTPNMDQLAAEGMMFTQAHSSSAVCTPSRYALLTGTYNFRTIVPGVGGNYGAPEVPESDVTIAEYLKVQGYQTAAFGKWHLGGALYDRQGNFYSQRNNGNNIPNSDAIDWERSVDGHAFDNGFDVYKGLVAAINFPPYVYLDGNRMQYFDTSTNSYRNAMNTDDYYNFSFQELAQGVVGADGRPGWGDPSYKQIDAGPKLVEDVESYIEDRVGDTDPFFIYAALHSPHKPWHTTPDFVDSEGFPYGDFMHEVDDRIGRMIKAIDDNGMADNTIIIVTSDNGPEKAAAINSYANGRDPNGTFRGLKRDSWEGGTRVPFIVRWPQVVEAGSVSDQLIWQGDIFKTLTHYFEDCPSENIAPDAVNILPILKGSNTSVSREAVITSSFFNQLSIKTTDGWKLIDGSGGAGHNPSRDSNNQPIPDAFGVPGGAEKQLFYLPDDRGETNNLYYTKPTKAAELLALLNRLKENQPATPSNFQTLYPSDAITVSAAAPADPGLQGDFVIRERRPANNNPNRHISGFLKFDLSNINAFTSANGDRALLEVKLLDRLNTSNHAALKIARITNGQWSANNLPQYNWATNSQSPFGPGTQADERVLIDNIANASLNSNYHVDVTDIVENWLNGNNPNYGFGVYLSDIYNGVSLDDFKLTIYQPEAQEENCSPQSFIPDPNKTYYLDVPSHNLRLAATGQSEDAYTTSTNDTGNNVQWKFVDKGNGFWHLQRAAGGSTPRLRSDNTLNADMQTTNNNGTYTYYRFDFGATSGTHHITLPDGPEEFKRLQMTPNGEILFTSTAFGGNWVSWKITESANLRIDETAIEIAISPNPAQNYINIDMKNFDDQNIEYIISSIQGQTLSTGKIATDYNETVQIDISSLQNGIYLIYLQSDNKYTAAQRIVIMREH